MEAGFDGVRSTLPTAYLLEQFLCSNKQTKRTDNYGGSLGKPRTSVLEVWTRVIAKLATAAV